MWSTQNTIKKRSKLNNIYPSWEDDGDGGWLICKGEEKNLKGS